ncbi:hypothetical protein [Hymenobacter convexus]|uniref:hypothetical protein n=1 Tax=Hymenobacter sp. CA1UV-4 TaxID=3063782 RepID=UPI002712C7C2|nr:hypothetical protein [Hymenobacter sp. CA1UV-4]MDO7850331.1 hypothetical protein [Hymenobacter sp. CA1UV-4]
MLTTSAATVLNPNLVAMPNGPGVTITSYSVTNLGSINGTLRYNGATMTTATVITDLTKLTYQPTPTPGFVGNASFQYSATDSNGFLANTATYTIPVSAVVDVVATFPATNPTSVRATGSLALTVNFTNAGVNDAAGVIRTVQLPAGIVSNGGTVTTTNGGVYDDNTGVVTYDPAATGAQGATTPSTLASGNDFFLFTATDNNGLTSNVARYTIPVGQDNASVYTTIGKRAATPISTPTATW